MRKKPGEVIKNLRKEQGLSQKTIAESVGVSIATISRYESGNRRMSVERYEQILSALNINQNQADA